MIQYYSVKSSSNESGSSEHHSRKATVETISKQLEYITKGHIATQTILFYI